MKRKVIIVLGALSIIAAGYIYLNPKIDRACRAAFKEIKQVYPSNPYVIKQKRYYGGAVVVSDEDYIFSFKNITGLTPNKHSYACLVQDQEGDKTYLYLQDNHPFYLGNRPNQNFLDVYIRD